MSSTSPSTDARREAAKNGQAMSDGSFPTRNKRELAKAIMAFGRADDSKKPALKAYLKKRAKALDAEGLIPDAWK